MWWVAFGFRVGCCKHVKNSFTFRYIRIHYCSKKKWNRPLTKYRWYFVPLCKDLPACNFILDCWECILLSKQASTHSACVRWKWQTSSTVLALANVAFIQLYLQTTSFECFVFFNELCWTPSMTANCLSCFFLSLRPSRWLVFIAHQHTDARYW